MQHLWYNPPVGASVMQRRNHALRQTKPKLAVTAMGDASAKPIVAKNRRRHMRVVATRPAVMLGALSLPGNRAKASVWKPTHEPI